MLASFAIASFIKGVMVNSKPNWHHGPFDMVQKPSVAHHSTDTAVEFQYNAIRLMSKTIKNINLPKSYYFSYYFLLFHYLVIWLSFLIISLHA